MNIFSQRDPRWASQKINGSNLTLGDSGCATACIAMMLTSVPEYENQTPYSVLKALEAVGGYTASGWVIWNNVTKAFPKMDFLGRDYVVADYDTGLIKPEVALTRAKKLLRIGQKPLLAVSLGGNPDKPNHWIIADEDLGNDLLIHDPWTGDRVSFRSRYGDPNLQIFGLSRFFGPVGEAPDMVLKSISFKAHEMKNAGPDEQYKLETYSKEIFNDLTV